MKYIYASLLTAFFSVFISTSASASELRLKNGTVYTGEIVGEDPQFYTMKTGNTTRAINKILIAEKDGRPYVPGLSQNKTDGSTKKSSPAETEKSPDGLSASLPDKPDTPQKERGTPDAWKITLTNGSVFNGKRISENARILVIESKGAPVSIFKNMIASIDSGAVVTISPSSPENSRNVENVKTGAGSTGPAGVPDNKQAAPGRKKTTVQVSTLTAATAVPALSAPVQVAPRNTSVNNKDDAGKVAVRPESSFVEKKFTAVRVEFSEDRGAPKKEKPVAAEVKKEPELQPNGLPVPRTRMTMVSFDPQVHAGSSDTTVKPLPVNEEKNAVPQPVQAKTVESIPDVARVASVSESIQVIPAPLPAFVMERKKAAADAINNSPEDAPLPFSVSSADKGSAEQSVAQPAHESAEHRNAPVATSGTGEKNVEMVPKLDVPVAAAQTPIVPQPVVAAAVPAPQKTKPVPLPMAPAEKKTEPVKKRTDGKVEIILDNGTRFIGTVKKEGPHSIAFESDGAVISILKRLIREFDGEPYQYEKPDSINASALASARRSHTTMKKQQLAASQRILFRIMPFVEIPQGLTAESLIDSMSRSTDWKERSRAARLIAAMGPWGVSGIPATVALLDDTAQSSVPVPLTLDSLEAQQFLAPGLEAARALAQLGNQGTNELLRAFRSDKALRRKCAVFGFGNCFFDIAVKCVNEALSDPSVDVRLMALSSLRVPDAQQPLMTACKDRDPEVRAAAVILLGKTGNPDALAVLRKMAHDKNSRVRSAVAQTVSMFGSVEDLPLLAQLCNDKDNFVRASAVKSLKNIEDSSIVDLCLVATRDSSAEVRLEAVEALSAIRSSRAIPALYSLVKDQNPLVREKAEKVLREHTDIPLLIAALDSGSEFVRSNAAYILWLLTAQEFGLDKAKWEEWAASRQRSEKTPANKEVLVNNRR